MILEVDVFEEFLPSWWEGTQTRANMSFYKMTINTEHIAWMRRCPLAGAEIELTDVHFGKSAQMFRVDKTYDEMKRIVGIKEKEAVFV